MNFYEITDKDKELIKVALNTLQNNFMMEFNTTL